MIEFDIGAAVCTFAYLAFLVFVITEWRRIDKMSRESEDYTRRMSRKGNS